MFMVHLKPLYEIRQSAQNRLKHAEIEVQTGQIGVIMILTVKHKRILYVHKRIISALQGVNDVIGSHHTNRPSIEATRDILRRFKCLFETVRASLSNTDDSQTIPDALKKNKKKKKIIDKFQKLV